MNNIIKGTVAALAILCVTAQGADLKWLDNFDKAKAQSSETKLPIFALFTGSDWCPGCMALESQILSKAEVKDFLAANTVPLLVDFPRTRKLQPGVAKQNEQLDETYNTEGYVPYLILLDKKGAKLATISLNDDFTPKGFIASLKAAIEKTKPAK